MAQYKEWCDTADICLAEIDNRASNEYQAGKFPTLVFISDDLYAILQKSMASQMRYSAPHHPSPPPQSIMSIMTAGGSLNVQQVRRLRNFLMIGRKEDLDAFTAAGVDPIFWNDQERTRIDKAFEDILILGGENG